MNYETRGKLEKTLRDYWKKKQKLEALNRKLKHIEKEIALFRGIYAEKEELIPSPSQISFTPGGVRGGSSEFTPIEKAVQIYEMNQAKIYEKIQYLRKQKIRIKWRIIQLENNIAWIEYILENHLDDFERQICEQCYCYNRSNIQVGIELNCDEATVRRKREKILGTFNEFLRVKV